MSMESDAKEAAIIKLLKAWRFGERVSDEQIDAYLEAVEDVSAEAVQRSCEQFRKGRVEGHNTEFVPQPATLAKNARQWDEAIAYITSSREMRKLQPVKIVKIGEPIRPPDQPLGPIRLEVGGIMRDTSDWSHEEKEEAIRTGKMPKSRRPGGALGHVKRLMKEGKDDV